MRTLWQETLIGKISQPAGVGEEEERSRQENAEPKQPGIQTKPSTGQSPGGRQGGTHTGMHRVHPLEPSGKGTLIEWRFP